MEKKIFSLKSSLAERFFFLKWLTKSKPEIFFDYNEMKVVEEDISKLLARADITESTQWLSVKKRKRGVFILF